MKGYLKTKVRADTYRVKMGKVWCVLDLKEMDALQAVYATAEFGGSFTEYMLLCEAKTIGQI